MTHPPGFPNAWVVPQLSRPAERGVNVGFAAPVRLARLWRYVPRSTDTSHGAGRPQPGLRPRMRTCSNFSAVGEFGFWNLAQSDPGHLALVDPDGAEMSSGELFA